MNLHDFLGVWHSSRVYYSTARRAEFTSEHYVRAVQNGPELVLESIPEHTEGHLVIRLHFENEVATGSWQESTNPQGHYQGEVYTGVLQLLVSDDNRSFTGKYLGPNKRNTISGGDWTLSYIGPELATPVEPLRNNEPK